MTEFSEPTLPKDVKRKSVQESTPDEARVLLWYADLQSKVGNPNLSSEETKDIATEIAHLMLTIEKSDGLSEDVQSEMIANVRRLDHIFVAVQETTAELRGLRLATRRRIFDPHQYEKAVKAVQVATLDRDIPESALDTFKAILDEYLFMVKEYRG